MSNCAPNGTSEGIGGDFCVEDSDFCVEDTDCGVEVGASGITSIAFRAVDGDFWVEWRDFGVEGSDFGVGLHDFVVNGSDFHRDKIIHYIKNPRVPRSGMESSLCSPALRSRILETRLGSASSWSLIFRTFSSILPPSPTSDVDPRVGPSACAFLA